MVESEMIEKVAEYKRELEYVTSRMNEIRKIVIRDEVSENTVDYLDTTFRDHFKRLFEIARKELLKYENNFPKEIIGVSKEEIRKDLDRLQDNYKNMRNFMKNKYNDKVTVTSRKLEILRKHPEGSEEVKDIEVPSFYTGVFTKQWNTKLNREKQTFDYKELDEVNKKILEISKKFSIKFDDQIMKFDALFENVTILLAEIENDLLSINNANSSVKKEELEDEIRNAKNMISELEIKLTDLEGNIDEKIYESYVSDLEKIKVSIEKLDKELDNVQVKVYDDQVKGFYNYTKNEILEANKEFMDYYDNILSTFEGYFDVLAVSIIDKKVAEFDAKIDDIRKTIENALKDGKIDEQLYNNLNEYLQEAEKTVSMIKSKKDDPKTYKESVRVEVASLNMDDLDALIVELEGKVDKASAPIKRDDRKIYERKINDIENKIRAMEVYFEENKDDKGFEKLAEYKERLEKIVSVYRKKCPFLVKAVKNAKDFYKKHKKVVLVAAGLATVALVHATVGPVIIPAIMQGNIMMGFTTPALRGFVTAANNILGGIINATNANGAWTLANGVVLNPSVASTSLLKGIAISGIGSATLIAPLVVGVKNLVQKMNMATLKEKLNKVNLANKLERVLNKGETVEKSEKTEEKKTVVPKSNSIKLVELSKAKEKEKELNVDEKEENVEKTIIEKTPVFNSKSIKLVELSKAKEKEKNLKKEEDLDNTITIVKENELYESEELVQKSNGRSR